MTSFHHSSKIFKLHILSFRIHHEVSTFCCTLFVCIIIPNFSGCALQLHISSSAPCDIKTCSNVTTECRQICSATPCKTSCSSPAGCRATCPLGGCSKMECKKTTIAATPGPAAVSYLSSVISKWINIAPDEFLAKSNRNIKFSFISSVNFISEESGSEFRQIISKFIYAHF